MLTLGALLTPLLLFLGDHEANGWFFLAAGVNLLIVLLVGVVVWRPGR